MEKISINVEDLARYIFEINTNNKIFLDINSIQTNKELFFFYFDLFCKGLIITFSESNTLLLNKLTEEDFYKIKKKFELAHIKLNMSIYDVETAYMIDICEKKTDLKEKEIIEKSIERLKDMDDNLELKEYEFNIYINGIINVISFEKII
tara:strand:- start:6904 stop:7353 length:450 start_codon:yes stop_codon:yes gene_type:complete